MGSCCKEKQNEKACATGNAENGTEEKLIGSFEDEPVKIVAVEPPDGGFWVR